MIRARLGVSTAASFVPLTSCGASSIQVLCRRHFSIPAEEITKYDIRNHLSKFCDMISCWFFPKPVIRWAFFWRVGKTTGPGFLKPSQANPEIANILISVLYVLGAVSRLYCLSSGLSLKSHKLFRTLAMKKTFYTRKMETSLNF